MSYRFKRAWLVIIETRQFLKVSLARKLRIQDGVDGGTREREQEPGKRERERDVVDKLVLMMSA